MPIPPRVSLITLGVSNVAHSTRFYQSLGWPLSSASVDGDVSFFNTDGGLLALWGRSDLVADAEIADPSDAGFRGVCHAINLESEADVDAAFVDVQTAGGKIVKPPFKTDWGGYTGYFSDPDGHLWEIAHNPAWPIGVDGRPVLPT